MARGLMFMGTGSDVGKSLIVAGLCRYFTQQGLRVRPFKPQNMSNNAAVTPEGGEIGRAQALQARACQVPPHVHMNPVLLKPQSEIGSQVIVQGKIYGTAKAVDYQAMKRDLMPAVLDSFHQLQTEADLILIEGAGSGAEINLRTDDIANWGFACASQTPVVLVGDIDRGGVIASVVGTHSLIGDEERNLLKGFLINKFRGDPALFTAGSSLITQKTEMLNFGTVPYFPAANKLPAEDALALNHPQRVQEGLKIVVLQTPRISNFDDLDPLVQEPGAYVQFLSAGNPIPGDADLVILAGSKATIADLEFVRDQGWDIDLRAHMRRGGRILGLCGGYQMLGTHIHDPQGVEGRAGTAMGLGLLEVQTWLRPHKSLRQVKGTHVRSGHPIQGYEMHIGTTTGPDCARAYLDFAGHGEGAQSPNGQIQGTYVHGLFAADGFRRAFVHDLGGQASDFAYETQVEQTLDDLATHLADNLDMEAILAAASPY